MNFLRTRTRVLACCTLLGTLPLWGLASTAQAADIHVPQDVKSLRRAVRKAQPGDRVIVAPGSYRTALKLRNDGVTVVAPEGATLVARGKSPLVKILADDCRVSGFTLSGGAILARGDDVELDGNTIRPRNGSRAVDVVGERAEVRDNRVEGLVLRGKRREVIRIQGAFSRVAGTTFNGIASPRATRQRPTIALRVEGESPRIEDNALTGTSVGVVVHGNDALVSGNELRLHSVRALEVSGDRARISENDFLHGETTPSSLRVTGSSNQVLGNRASGTFQGTFEGSDNTLLDTQVAASEGRDPDVGVALTGDRNRVERLTVYGGRLNSFTVEGSDNVFVDLHAVDAPPSETTGIDLHIRFVGHRNTFTQCTFATAALPVDSEEPNHGVALRTLIAGDANVVKDIALDVLTDPRVPIHQLALDGHANEVQLGGRRGSLSIFGDDNFVSDADGAVTCEGQGNTLTRVLGSLDLKGDANLISEGGRGSDLRDRGYVLTGDRNVVRNCTVNGRSSQFSLSFNGDDNRGEDLTVIAGRNVGASLVGNRNTLERVQITGDSNVTGLQFDGDQNGATDVTLEKSFEASIVVLTGNGNALLRVDAGRSDLHGLRNFGGFTSLVDSTLTGAFEVDIVNYVAFGTFTGNEVGSREDR